MLDALVLVAAFTAGLSVLFLEIAGGIKWIRGSPSGARGAVRELQDEVELLRGAIDRLRNSLEQATRPPNSTPFRTDSILPSACPPR